MHRRDSDGTRKKLPLTPGQQQMLSRRRHLLLAVRPQHPERSEHGRRGARPDRAMMMMLSGLMTSVVVIIMMDLLYILRELCTS